jgi:phosphohistidine phosphatase
MELILWRHAEAEPGEPDEERVLTAKGRKQAARMAEWLDRNLPSRCRIFVSPTKRTLQTAQALGRKFKVETELAPDAAPETILKIAKWPDAHEPVLIVGHQPTLGQVASLLIAGTPQNWSIRKANVWWITRKENEGRTHNFIRAVITPDLFVK